MRIETPRGVKDFLPADAYWKLETEAVIRRCFQQWGYQEVLTPSFEYFHTLNSRGSQEDQILKFLDHDGRLLALRPDMTTPIARMAAARFRDALLPLRFSYLANVYRSHQEDVGREREFFQAGVECLGVAGPGADAEVLAVAACLLTNLGVEEFHISLGHVQFFNGLIEECPDREARREIRRAFVDQDFVGLTGIVRRSPLPSWVARLLLELPQSSGRDDVLGSLRSEVQNAAAQDALDNAAAIMDYLKAHELHSGIHWDFAMVKSLDYYTGLIFEGYAPHLGFSLFTGGRYNHLLGQFGRDLPAVGFALGLERLLFVLEQQGRRLQPPDVDLLVVPIDLQRGLALAREERERGNRVEVELTGLTPAEAAVFARRRNIARVATVTAAEVQWQNTQGRV